MHGSTAIDTLGTNTNKYIKKRKEFMLRKQNLVSNEKDSNSIRTFINITKESVFS